MESTRTLLARYIRLLAKHGVDSVKAQAMLDRYSLNAEFVELAELTRTLKQAFNYSHRLESRRMTMYQN